MIGWLHGVVRHKQAPCLLLDVCGVGYELEAPTTIFNNLPELGQSVSLYVHHQLRENGQSLFAFSSEYERDVFRQLIRITGIGAKLALVLLSGMTVEELSTCVHNNDVRSLSRLPGIGKKTAERLVMELQHRIANNRSDGGTAPPAGHDAPADAISALIALGLKATEATRRVQAVQSTKTQDLGCEQLVRLALQSMA